MKTLFLCFYGAYPVTGGASSVTYQLARHWPGQRILVQVGPDPDEQTPEPGLRLVTLPFSDKGRVHKLRQVPRWIRSMVKIAQGAKPDLIVLEGASWIAYHWRLLLHLRHALPRTTVMYHSHNVEYDLRRQKHGLAVSAITRLLERRVLAKSTMATAVSDADQRRFRELYGTELALLPNGVDGSWLMSASPADCEAMKKRYGLGRNPVLFMGSYAYRPNQEAIDFLVEEVFPRVVAQRPDAQLAIVGGDVPYHRPWLVNPGLLPAAQLPAVISAARVSVAPIFSGSGTRLKIVEALVAGTPVVTTPKGMEGLSLDPGWDILIAESADEFAKQIGSCLDASEQTRDRFRHVAEKVRKRYEWQALIQGFIESLPPHFQERCIAQTGGRTEC